MKKLLCALATVAAFTGASAASAQERAVKVRNDRKTVEGDGYWIYNNLPRAFEEAKETGKPLLVVIRCIPCEACAQLDAQVVGRDPTVQELMDQFVCVRVVQANGLDLELFQYDYDQSMAAFFLNADRTIYGRYGTRSHETESERDVSVEGFAQALAGALELHANYPANAASLRGKRGPKVDVQFAEQFPTLKEYSSKLNYEGDVVKSCIHCHQVGEALRDAYREKRQSIPEQVLYPYPLPNVLGLTLSPKARATVLEVANGSSAESDGFKVGDDIVSLGGQPLLSIADVQWVLHRAQGSAPLPAVVVRDGKKVRLSLTLKPGWRQRGDISWRATSWDLRRMTTGGLLLVDLSPDERRKADLPDDALALRVKHVGQYGAHAAAKNAGFQQGDVLIEVDGARDRLSESQLMARLVNQKFPGDSVAVIVLREGRQAPLKLPIQ